MELTSSNNQITGENRPSTARASFENPQNDTNTNPQSNISRNNQNMIRESIVPSTNLKFRIGFFWSKMTSSRCFFPLVVVVAASIAIIVGVLAVCFAARDKSNKSCLSMFSKMIEYKLGSHSKPTSVAVGDFNNDQILDMVTTNSLTDNIGVFLGYGDGTFTNQITFPTGYSSKPTSVVVGDFNNDTWLDIAVANLNTNNVGIFIGNGNGSFKQQMIFSTYSSRPQAITVGDFNNDNRLDITTANSGTQTIGVFLGHGDGTFSRQITYSTGYDSNPTSIAVGDFNHDNRLDICVINQGTVNVGVFLGYGNGSFARQTTYSTGMGSILTSIATGDFNGDGRLDIVIANMNGVNPNMGIFLGYGNGSFAEQVTYTDESFSEPSSVTVGDFNNDTRLDIAVTDSANDGVIIMLGDGTGSFTFLGIYSTGTFSLPMSGAIGDFNKDARLDIAVTASFDGNVAIFLGYGNGSLHTPMTFNTGTGPQPQSVAAGDFNNDSRLDIVLANWRIGCLGVFLGYGNGSFSNQTLYSTGDHSLPQSVAVGDLNNDNKLDIIVANSNNNNVGVFLGYGNGSFAPQITFSTGTGSTPFSVAVNDLNNDSQLDVVVSNKFSNNIAVLLGHGNGSLTLSNTYFTGDGSQPSWVAVGDFNNDNKLDIVVANAYPNNIGLFLGYGNGSFASQIILSVGDLLSPQSIAIGDFNNDSRLDMVVAMYSSDGICVLLGYGNGSFSVSPLYSTSVSSSPQAVAVGDFNDDTRLDIAVANNAGNNVGIFLGYGNGSFTDVILYPAGFGSSPSGLAIGDFNSDAQLDIATANNAANSLGIFLKLC